MTESNRHWIHAEVEEVIASVQECRPFSMRSAAMRYQLLLLRERQWTSTADRSVRLS